MSSMSFEEKRAWIMAVVTPVAYAAYLLTVLARARGGPLHEVTYVSALLWSMGATAVASIVLTALVGLRSPGECDRKDERDRQIHRFGEYVGQSVLVVGGVAALALAMLEVRHFWIANAVYLSFVLTCVLSSATKIVAYRRGIPDC
jgi:hypothetical protein